MVGRLIAFASWIALTAFVVLLAKSFVPACELNLAGYRFRYCPEAEAAPRVPTVDPIDQKMAEIHRLESELLAKPICRPPQAPAPQQTPRVAPTSIDRPECFKQHEATRVVFAVDGSGSMDLPIDLSPAEDRYLQYHLLPPGSAERKARDDEFQSAKKRPGEKRVDVVRREVGRHLKQMGENARAVIFPKCGTANSYIGRAAADAVLTMQAEEGTDIIEALKSATRMLPQAGNSTIVLISDGSHSCEGTNDEVCKLTRDLKSQMPGLIINVIDLAGWAAVECVARESGGILRRANNLRDIDQMLKMASTVAPSGKCDAIEGAH